ncbi:TIGR01741 family protein [Staphylococcus haemolyticus]|uniref:TIGR01741 family protein n=1 Tax=Staphylococcus TaxID=1279 RepID=UPI00069D7FD4|nr:MULTISPECIES: TIGR01741 family protein [Staphylococcus]KAA2274873.1 TIGR01741 family protein [Staphylococcus sp. GDX7P312P]KAA2277953.1 TIGR01741 family protein [Staphylococcus sp. GDX7P459A]MCE4954516.1 TIGR01741 family protein [Staphylococcus haemolyticus]PTL03486.1 TIGR01741 family protein [Staphylococcus haemolyticus]PTL14995.1 TIGR01741 family protein [Staphylococcus haemolyticus]
MEFEENLNEMYQEIANHINNMIPTEWEQVYTVAYIDKEGGEVLFYYTKPRSNDLHYYTNIPKDYNVSEKIFSDLWGDLFGLFDKLRESFKEVNQEPWTSCEFDFTNKGKLKISFDYIDWKNSDFGPMARKNYYKYKKFGILPEKEYAKNKVKKVEQFIKEQEEK